MADRLTEIDVAQHASRRCRYLKRCPLWRRRMMTTAGQRRRSKPSSILSPLGSVCTCLRFDPITPCPIFAVSVSTTRCSPFSAGRRGNPMLSRSSRNQRIRHRRRAHREDHRDHTRRRRNPRFFQFLGGVRRRDDGKIFVRIPIFDFWSDVLLVALGPPPPTPRKADGQAGNRSREQVMSDRFSHRRGRRRARPC